MHLAIIMLVYPLNKLLVFRQEADFASHCTICFHYGIVAFFVLELCEAIPLRDPKSSLADQVPWQTRLGNYSRGAQGAKMRPAHNHSGRAQDAQALLRFAHPRLRLSIGQQTAYCRKKRERKSRRDVKPKQRKDVVVVFSVSMLLYKKVSVWVALGNRRDQAQIGQEPPDMRGCCKSIRDATNCGGLIHSDKKKMGTRLRYVLSEITFVHLKWDIPLGRYVVLCLNQN